LKKVTESFLLPCTPEVFWRVFMDEAYVRSLYIDGLEFKGFEVKELGESSRKLRIVPKLNLPSALARLIGDAFAYEEHGVLDRAKGEWTWQMVHTAGSVGSKLVSTRGTVRVEANGEGACRRYDELIVEGKLFGLGGLIESSAEKEARSAWSKELPFMTKWLARATSASESAGSTPG
jgi:hypothetical protein